MPSGMNSLRVEINIRVIVQRGASLFFSLVVSNFSEQLGLNFMKYVKKFRLRRFYFMKFLTYFRQIESSEEMQILTDVGYAVAECESRISALDIYQGSSKLHEFFF